MINLNNMANQKQGRWLRMVAHVKGKAKKATARSPFFIGTPTCTRPCFCSALSAMPTSVSTMKPPARNSLRLSGLSTPACAVLLLVQWWQRNKPRPCGPLPPLKLWNTSAGNCVAAPWICLWHSYNLEMSIEDSLCIDLFCQEAGSVRGDKGSTEE
jgi:hypothetical protein